MTEWETVPCPACAPPNGDGNGTRYKPYTDVYLGKVTAETYCGVCWGRGELQPRMIPAKYKKKAPR